MFGFLTNAGKDRFMEESMKHLDALYGTALRMTRNPADAEDLIQDTLLKAYRARDTYANGTNRRAWLFKILTNTFINNYHSKKREMSAFNRDMDFSDLEERFVDDWSESNFAVNRLPFSEQMSDEVAKAFEGLPDAFKVVVELADLQDFSYAEIADIVGCPIGTVMSRLSRGRKLLQDSLMEYAIREGVIRPGSRTNADHSVQDISDARVKKVQAQ
jgi:RNA polymerase sigma-70 factor (ECF subfamily)